MSNEKGFMAEIQKLTQQLKLKEEELDNQTHEHRKALLQANAKLDFETKRADEYEQKYKSAIQFKNQQAELREMLSQLDRKLREKQNREIQFMKNDEEKDRSIDQLNEQIEKLNTVNTDLKNQLNVIKEAAFSAIVEKDNQISDLTAQLQQFQDNDSINGLKATIVDMQQKYHELQERLENEIINYINKIESKDEEINELQQKIILIKQKHDERIMRFEQQIADYEKHIEQVNAEKDNQQNLEEKYYMLEEKLRKTERKLSQTQNNFGEQKGQFIAVIQKLQLQVENLRNQNEEFKQLKQKFKDLQKQNNTKKKQIDEFKQKIQKVTLDFGKKFSTFERQKRLMGDNLQNRQHQIDRLRGEVDDKNDKINKLKESIQKQKQKDNLLKSSLAAQIKLTVSPTKASLKQNQDVSSAIQKLKKHNKELEENNNSLKKRIEQQTKQLQDLRQRLIQASGSAKSAEQAKYLVQIEQLNSYLKKVENDMLRKKIAHAEDENFWNQKQKKYKEQIQKQIQKFNKEKQGLIQRIDFLKKLVPKDKKSQYYYLSGFK